MKKYYINIHSPKIAIILFLILFPIILYVLTLSSKGGNPIIPFIIFIGLLIGAGYLITILSRARVKIELTEEGFKHLWIRKFVFSRDKDIELKWSQIINYVYQEGRGYESFQLTLPENKRYKILRYNYFPQKDDFEKFISQFPGFINKLKESTDNKIEKGKSMFEEPAFKWIMIIFTAILTLLIINKILNPENSTSWIVCLCLSLIIGFYWIQMRINKKKN
jgi:hypothetical protein